MKVLENVALAEYTTFRVGGAARFFVCAGNEDELKEALTFAEKQNMKVFILGGGSNILFSDEGFDGLVIKIDIRGIEWNDDEDTMLCTAGAGENWDALVEEAVRRNLYGIENLSGIPGTVGASVVQNIGAYGVEVGTCVHAVEVFNIETEAIEILTPDLCAFAYRDSIFKKKEGKKFIVLRVTYHLHKDGVIDVSYKDLQNYFGEKSEKEVPLQELRTTVLEIRSHKFPRAAYGTAGSFFKNPIIQREAYQALRNHYPELPCYALKDGAVKVPLGWIIEHICHMKGYCIGDACVHDKQALVLINKGAATAGDIEILAQEIENCVHEKTGIKIEREVLCVQ